MPTHEEIERERERERRERKGERETGRKKRRKGELPNEIKFNIHTVYVRIKILIPMEIIPEKESKRRGAKCSSRERERPAAIS